MALAARATTRLQFPDLDADQAEAELNEAVAKLRELGDGWAESMAEVGLGFLAVVRGRIEEALAHFSRSAEMADEGQNMHTRIVAGNNRTRVLFMLGQVDAAEQEWFLTLSAVGSAPLRRGCGICARGHVRGRGVAWRWMACGRARGRRGRHPAEHGDLRHRGFRGAHGATGGAPRERPESVAAGERAGAEMSFAEAIALALPNADADVRESLAQW